jgi:hypothetical protein
LVQVDDDELRAKNISDALNDEGLAGSCKAISVKGLKESLHDCMISTQSEKIVQQGMICTFLMPTTAWSSVSPVSPVSRTGSFCCTQAHEASINLNASAVWQKGDVCFVCFKAEGGAG